MSDEQTPQGQRDRRPELPGLVRSFRLPREGSPEGSEDSRAELPGTVDRFDPPSDHVAGDESDRPELPGLVHEFRLDRSHEQPPAPTPSPASDPNRSASEISAQLAAEPGWRLPGQARVRRRTRKVKWYRRKGRIAAMAACVLVLLMLAYLFYLLAQLSGPAGG